MGLKSDGSMLEAHYAANPQICKQKRVIALVVCLVQAGTTCIVAEHGHYQLPHAMAVGCVILPEA